MGRTRLSVNVGSRVVAGIEAPVELYPVRPPTQPRPVTVPLAAWLAARL